MLLFPWNPSSHLFLERAPASNEQGNKTTMQTHTGAHTHTQREVTISHLVADFCDYKSWCHPPHTTPLYQIHHPRHLQTHLRCVSNQQHYNFNNDKELSMITSLSSQLFPSPNDTIQLPFFSRFCILVPIVYHTQYNNRNVCDTGSACLSYV